MYPPRRSTPPSGPALTPPASAASHALAVRVTWPAFALQVERDADDRLWVRLTLPQGEAVFQVDAADAASWTQRVTALLQLEADLDPGDEVEYRTPFLLATTVPVIAVSRRISATASECAVHVGLPAESGEPPPEGEVATLVTATGVQREELDLLLATLAGTGGPTPHP